MIAASVWSLLLPAIEMSEHRGVIPWGSCSNRFFWLGFFFLLLLDRVIPHLHNKGKSPEGPASNLKDNTMLMLAVNPA